MNAYFESAATYWKKIYSGDRLLPAIYRDRHNTALRWVCRLDLPSHARILEVGCGAGLITVALARNGHTVDAMDSTAAMLEVTRKGAAHRGVEDRIRLHLADAHALPFDAQTFDLVIAIGVIPWLHSEAVAIQEMQRVLKPGGYLFVTADNNARLNRILDPLSCPLLTPLRLGAKGLLEVLGLWSPDSAFQPKRHYPRQVNRLIGNCGFEEVKSCTVGFGPFTLFGKQLFSETIGVRLNRRLQALASRRGVAFLRWTGSHYLVLGRKVRSSTGSCDTVNRAA